MGETGGTARETPVAEGEVVNHSVETGHVQMTKRPDPNSLPIGTPVLAFVGTRDGQAAVTRTRSLPWIIGGSICVMVEGVAGGIALTHIEVLPDA